MTPNHTSYLSDISRVLSDFQGEKKKQKQRSAIETLLPKTVETHNMKLQRQTALLTGGLILNSIYKSHDFSKVGTT